MLLDKITNWWLFLVNWDEVDHECPDKLEGYLFCVPSASHSCMNLKRCCSSVICLFDVNKHGATRARRGQIYTCFDHAFFSPRFASLTLSDTFVYALVQFTIWVFLVQDDHSTRPDFVRWFHFLVVSAFRHWFVLFTLLTRLDSF
jgi:hypothetical protein